MPKKENEKIKYKTQKAKKVKYPEAKIQLFDYDQATGSKKEKKEKKDRNTTKCHFFEVSHKMREK